MVVLASIAHLSEVLMLCVLVVAVVYIMRIRRSLQTLLVVAGDRHIELRGDLKKAREAREEQRKESIHWRCRTTEDLKRAVDFTATIAEAVEVSVAGRKTLEMDPRPLLAAMNEAPSTDEEQQPSKVRVPDLQASAAHEGNTPEATGERVSQTEGETGIWSRVATAAMTVGVDAPPPSAFEAHGEAGASVVRP